MAEIFNEIEKILAKIWDALYVYLCEIMGEEVNEDWLLNKDTEE